MEQTTVTLLSVVIGGAIALIPTWIQARFQNKRERMRLVMEIALQDYKTTLEMAKEHKGQGTLYPLALFIHYHTELMRLVEQNELSPESIAALQSKTEAFVKEIDKNPDFARGVWVK